MEPLPPPGLDFAKLLLPPFPPLQSALDLFLYLLFLPIELIGRHVGVALGTQAVGAGLGALVELLIVVLLVLAVLAAVVTVLVLLGVGAMLAAVVTAFATRRRGSGRSPTR